MPLFKFLCLPFQIIEFCIDILVEFLIWNCSFLKSLKKNMSQFSSEKVGMLFFLMAAIITLVMTFLPGQQVFEGNLITREIRFTYIGNEDKRFLGTIREIQNLDLEGQQTIVLVGNFKNDTDPKLNQLDKITVEMTYPRSRLIISPTNPEKIELELTELNLNPSQQLNSKQFRSPQVKQLKFEPAFNALSFCLQLATEPRQENEAPTVTNEREELCNNPDLFSRDASRQPEPLGILNLKLGTQPLNISLEQVNIPELGILADVDNPNLINFQFSPQLDQPEIVLNSPTTIFIQLPSLEDNSGVFQWLRGNLQVRDVNFTGFDGTGDLKDEVPISTILWGNVKMGDKTIELTENQFLIDRKKNKSLISRLIAGKDLGIINLRYLQIRPASQEGSTQIPAGLQARFVGKSKEISVGIDPDFPVKKIQPTLLTSWGLSAELVTILRSFCIGLIGIFLPTVLKSSSSSNSNS